MHRSAVITRISILLLTVIALLGFRFIVAPPPAITWQLLLHGSYPMLLLLLGCNLFFGLKVFFSLNGQGLLLGQAGLRFHFFPLLSALFLSVLWLVHEPFAFKVLQDEYAHLAHSKMLHLFRVSGNPGAVHFIENQIRFFDFHPHMRGPLFATLLSILHDFTGYRPTNAFVLNSFLGAILLALTYTVAYQWSRDRVIALIPVLMVFATPIFAQVATSGSYDLLNAVQLLIFLLVGRQFLNHPGPNEAGLFISTALLLAYGRSESILYLLPLAAVFAVVWWRQKEVVITRFAAVSPVFLFIPFLLNLHYSQHEEYSMPHRWTEGRSGMGLAYVPENLAEAVYFFFNPSAHSVASAFVSAIALVGMLLLLVSLLRARKALENDALIFLFALAGAGLAFFVLLSHFWTSFNDYQASRFSIPLYLFGSLCVVFVVKRLQDAYRWLQAGTLVLLVVALHAFVFGLPQQAAHPVTKSMFPPQYTSWFLDHAQAQEDPAILYVSKGPRMFAAYGLPGIGLERAIRSPERLANAVRMGLYNEIHVVELYTIHSNLPLVLTPHPDFEHFGDEFELTVLAEKRFTPYLLGRISRVAAVKDTVGNWVSLEPMVENLPSVQTPQERASLPFLLVP